MVNGVTVFLFWFFAAVIVYTYAGYPILLVFASKILRKPVEKKAYEPCVSVILSAFNEEKMIEQKLSNLLELDYPKEKLEILVGSDGASDRTDEIVSRFSSPQIRFFRFVENFGKPHVLSALVEEARGEILVFTDVRQELDRGTVRALVSNFGDAEVGCVSGELYFKKMVQNGRGSLGEGIDLYWRYEKFLRKRESQISSMLGATGALYAIRKTLFPKFLPADVLVDDMYIPFEIISNGYRAVLESNACAYDCVSGRSGEEFKRKVRTLAGNYQIFMHFPGLFLPFKSPIAWQLFSHKFLRLVVPYFLLGLFLINSFMLSDLFYFLCFSAQILFYGMAVYEVQRTKISEGKKGIGYIPYVFCLLNYSAVMGLLRFLKGWEKASWEKAYA